MKVVIVGCGRVGAGLANLLSEDGHDVTIIDKEEGSFSRLGKKTKARAVLGVGIDLDLLKEAGIEKADAFAAVTNGDNSNYMCSRLAKEVFRVPKVVARLYDPNRLALFKNAGIPAMCSTIIGARALREMITRGAVATHLMADRRFLAEELAVTNESVGKTISEIEKERDAKVVAVFRATDVLLPQPTDLVHAADVLLCIRPTMPLLGM